MTTENKEELLRLYKLLWEQINEKQRVRRLIEEGFLLFQNENISDEEEDLLFDDLMSRCDSELKTTPDRKSFVQRMITELENEINSSNNSSSSTKAKNN